MISLKKILLSVACLMTGLTAGAQTAIGSMNALSDTHAIYRLQTTARYLLLPVEEKEENARVRVIKGHTVVKEFNCRLALDKKDYMVPLDLKDLQGEPLLLDITFSGNRRSTGNINDFAVWKLLKTADTFDASNRERFRPAYHHTPVYGWMNDPNGMFYKDGVWHLYFQYNPYGSTWENMTWGHSTSRDLIHWQNEGEAIEPDALGTIFSGSSVVDHNNTAGFGAGAIVAMYTSAGANQTQSLAYSTDGGKTFQKYSDNPIITSSLPDFRDPHMFWSEEYGRWYMILAAGQEMQIYSSANLKQWKHESSFGHEYGNHGGVWECPDLFKLPVKNATSASQDKWVLLCNINPGGPFGGSATQYFTGHFDGHRFVCETKPEVTKWMDYGKDHYAAVSFDNAPDGRRVALAWMSNWQYANQVPTTQYRSANAVPRDLGLFEYKGDTFLSSTPSKELLTLRGKKGKALTSTCELVVDFRHSATVTLSNARGEQVVLTYDADRQTLSMDRTKSGDVQFSDAFPCVTTAPTLGKLGQLRVFIDKCSVEAIDAEGKVAMTNLVFPSEPYTKVTLKGKARCTVYNLK